MTRPRAWRLDRVRTRLLAAFGVLLVAAIALAAVGWVGMRSTQQALAGVEDDLLPSIAHALELAQRTTQLAAIAPKLAESHSEAELEANRATVEGLLGQIERRSADLQPTRELQGVLNRLRDNIGGNIAALIELTQRKQALQARFARQLARLDRLGQRLHAGGGAAPDPVLLALWSSLVLGTATDDPATLGRLQADVEALTAAARRRGVLGAVEPALAQELAGQATGPEALLVLRHALLDLDRRTAYLVVLTRANADELSEQVSRDVAQLRATAAERSTRVQRAVRSGETGMLALALVCLVIAVGATRYVRRLVAQIETITGVMSRLAQGDTAQATPATNRRDELGALARSFELFRGHLLAKQQLLGALHSQRELLEAVHESLTDGLAVFDRGAQLLLWNTRFREMFGRHGALPREGMTARALLDALPPQTTWLTPGRSERQPIAGTTGVLARLDHFELRLPSGEVLDLRSRRMPGGGSVTLVTDLTERRASESQLQQAQKLEVLGQLTGGVAHDFNNYLGTILGTLALLEVELGDPKPHAQWQRVQRAAASAAALTRRLLAFARRAPLQAEDLSVDEMVQEMLDLIEYSAGPQVTVTLALDSAPWRVHLDRGQLENALLNLVLNSAAAMPDGGRLEVATRRVDGPAIELRVADSGAGMPEALLDKVFEPFFTTKDGNGSGLGLSIVYGFVKQSGGDVRLESRPGAGTTVMLTLPASREPSADAAERAATDGGTATLEGLRVLVIDDDAAFRDTVQEMLVSAGAQPYGVPSAEAALAALEAGVLPDIVLSDICLGAGFDGLRLARLLGQRWPELPVVLMSGLAPELLPQHARWTAELPFLAKPFARDTLAATLRGAVVSRV